MHLAAKLLFNFDISFLILSISDFKGVKFSVWYFE